jgi:hypothetical protein
MTMQIKAVVLYNHKGEQRKVDFRLGGVNIVLGVSNTGKSTLIKIIDYCLGKSNFDVYAGVTRDSVSWYGLLLQSGERQLFIARSSPTYKRQKPRAYIERGENLNLPSLDILETSTTGESEILDSIIAVQQPDANISATLLDKFRHIYSCISAYLFQEKTVLANNQVLFHKHSQLAPLLKDTKSFYLGALTQAELLYADDLVQAKSDLAIYRRKLTIEQGRARDYHRIAESLLSEAQEVGLVAQHNS